MKLLETNSGRYSNIGDEDDALHHAACRIVSRLYGRDHFPRRTLGWNDLTGEFSAELCRSVGDITEHTEQQLQFRVQQS